MQHDNARSGRLRAAPGSVGEAKPLIAAATRVDGSPPVSDQALVAASQGHRELLLFTEEAGGPTVAVGVVGQGELDLVVAPAARGRGVGTLAFRELRARAAAHPLLAWAHGVNPAATALLRAAGFAPVRSLYRMQLDPALLPERGANPFQVPLPEGFTLRTFGAAPGDEAGDAAAWVRVNARAFADHPEQGAVTLADFALMREEPWFAADDLFVLEASSAAADAAAAASSSQLAGFTWVKTVRTMHESAVQPGDAAAQDATPRADGSSVATELYAIGIDPAFAGQGLGRALLGVTLARMAQHDPVDVSLYVDGENVRAVELYERAGFTIASRSTQWRGRQVSE